MAAKKTSRTGTRRSVKRAKVAKRSAVRSGRKAPGTFMNKLGVTFKFPPTPIEIP